VNPFGALVTCRLPAASPGEGVAVKTAATTIVSKTTTVTANPLAGLVTCGPPPTPASSAARTTAAATEVAPVNPFAGWVTCGPPPTPASTTPATAAATEVAPVNPLAGLVTAPPAVTAASTSNSTSVQPGISALIGAIMNGSFQPTDKTPSQLVENTPLGTVYDSPAYYASDQTAQQLAALLGGTVVQKVPFASSNAATTEPKANFIQLPSGQTVNAADLAYYAKFGGYGAQQLAADLTQEINQGGAITSYNDQMVAFLSGKGNYPGASPTFQANVIGPPIAGMTYPPGTLAADGSVINPMAPNGVGS
jgi:hypothetical protein